MTTKFSITNPLFLFCLNAPALSIRPTSVPPFIMPRSEASRRKVMIIGTAVGLSVILFIVLMVVFLPKNRIKIVVDDDTDTIECPGFTDAKSCRNAGCEYEKENTGPACFMKKGSFGYKMGEVKEDDSGMTVKLESRVGNTPYGSSISSVSFQVSYITQDIVRVKFVDNNSKRYEVPVQFPLLGKDTKKIDPSSMVYEVNLSNNTDLFSFQIKRKSDQTVLWDTSIGGLMMSDKFLQISSYLPSKNIYGLGENVHTSLRHDMEYKTWPMFARDRFPEAGPNNLYGVHPFYMCLEKSSNTHGVLLLNSNAMEVSLLPAPGITFRTIGGIIDLFFIVGKEPENTVKLYTSLIGKPMMPPYWSLGFQLSRYGYNSLDTVKKVVERTRKAGIPQDVQFLDIDHMEVYEQTREEYGLKWIIILDPAIEAVKSYGTFETGIKKDVFIKRSHLWKEDMFPPEVKEYKNTTFGRVWPASYVAFPNFFDDNAKQWWTDSIVEHHKLLPFEGLWIDMNEPASFGTNEDRPFYCPATGDCWSLKCPDSPYEDPPYNPLKTSGSERLSKMTLCMESVHTDGKTNYRHYDVHSLYGWSQAAEKAVGARSLVISRSTYPSSGRHAGHWLGDNRSTWNDLKYSIIGMLEFNMF
ncbi:sucrase-isomaltase, intestinal [Caerostris extrusa]|uniref:Maltase n=1 Tax=Caerostris extrusa TaxID=172846 RepID=A0AAV4UB84_CAEEX|nr:sucrase-isomaltase, intestinal [Caerostris extrusa]